MRIAHVQEVNFTINAGSSSRDIALSGTFDDFSKMAVLGVTHDLTQDPTLPEVERESRMFIYARLLDVGGGAFAVRFIRWSGVGESSTTGTAYVVQFESSVNVYKGSTILTNGASNPQAVTANINSGSPMVLNDLSKAFVLFTCAMSNGESTHGIDCESSVIMSKFLDTSTLEFSRYSDATYVSVEWTVIESPDIEVERHSVSLIGTDTGFIDYSVFSNKPVVNTFHIISQKQYGPWYHTWIPARKGGSSVGIYRTVNAVDNSQTSTAEVEIQRVYDSSIRSYYVGYGGAGGLGTITGDIPLQAVFDKSLSVIIPAACPPEKNAYVKRDEGTAYTWVNQTQARLSFSSTVRWSISYQSQDTSDAINRRAVAYGFANVIEFNKVGVDPSPPRSLVVT